MPTTDAEMCRRRGWTVGTRLTGDEGYGPTTIEITAIGRDSILAVCIDHNGKECYPRESIWSLAYRAWDVAS